MPSWQVEWAQVGAMPAPAWGWPVPDQGPGPASPHVQRRLAGGTSQRVSQAVEDKQQEEQHEGEQVAQGHHVVIGDLWGSVGGGWGAQEAVCNRVGHEAARAQRRKVDGTPKEG